uniref:Tospovirus resistance protein C n=1 Tax=Solanum tuberosum TaxID=4113 RepID=M1D2Z3_SOLTU
MFLNLTHLRISRWVASEESFPLLERFVIKECYNLEEIPLSFAYIPTLKHIKLIRCKNKPLEASALRIKDDVEENEGNDRIDLIIKVSKNKLLCFVFEYLPASNLTPICIIRET